MLGDITLAEFTPANWRASLALSVRPDQQRFVADSVPIAAIVLAKAYVGAGNRTWTPLLIMHEKEPVGLVALNVSLVESPAECWIFHFFIDQAYQAKGLGRAALSCLIEEIRRRYPACETLFLSVHPENIPAQRLYESAAFQRTGADLDGDPIYALALHH